MNNTKALLTLFFFLIFSSIAAQEEIKTIPSDSSKIEVRKFDAKTIERLKADPDMDYGHSPAGLSLWERFKIWLRNFISRLLTAAVTTNWVNVLIGLLSVVLIIYVILRLLKVDAFKIFYSQPNKKLAFGSIEEDIHSMDFDKLIQDALQKLEYRLAIRLVFLQALKLLADNHLIHWQPGKTNHDYLNELTEQNLKTGFNELNFYFEYAWYGNFSINEGLYKKVENIFKGWKTNI